MNQVGTEAEDAVAAQRDAGMQEGLGIQVEFESFPELALAFESLARENQGIEVLNVRQRDKVTRATVFVPDGQLDHFEKLIIAYIERRTDASGRRIDNQRLLDTIRQIRTAGIQALWTDEADMFPADADLPVWWEVWLPVRQDRDVTTAAFRQRTNPTGSDSTSSGHLNRSTRFVVESMPRRAPRRTPADQVATTQRG